MAGGLCFEAHAVLPGRPFRLRASYFTQDTASESTSEECCSAKENTMEKRSIALTAWILLAAVPALFSGASFVHAGTYPVTIKNNCDQKLFVRGASETAFMPGDGTWVDEKGSKVVQLTLPWKSGRIYGCVDSTIKDLEIRNKQNGFLMQHHCGLVELGVEDNTAGKGNLFSNISFVDTLSNMTVRIEAPGGRDCSNSGHAIAYFTTLKEGNDFFWIGNDKKKRKCPTGIVENGEFRACLSANKYCTDAAHGNPSDPMCGKLDRIIRTCADSYADCAAAGGATTVDVYGCSGSFFSSPSRYDPEGKKYCAAINRGILEKAENQKTKDFYPDDGTFNDYAAFVHAVTGSIFAFSYDDYPDGLNQGGYVNCRESTQYVVEFCPDPAARSYSHLGNSSLFGVLDTDVFKFSGRKGEKVTLGLEPVSTPGTESESYESEDAVMTLIGPLSFPLFQKRVRGSLPLHMELALPYTGRYRAVIHNLLTRSNPFAGPYGLTLESSRRAWKTLKPERSVE